MPRRAFEELVRLLQSGQALDAAATRRAIDMVQADENPSEILTAEVFRAPGGRIVRPKSSGQKRYVEAIRANVVTFGIGPAGNRQVVVGGGLRGQALTDRVVDRIILTRPAVEAGERLGFLPGDLMAKVDPYLRPLYDALHDMVGTEATQKLLEKRGRDRAARLHAGRTLNNSFIICDEAQNTTPEQMKMFLTRIGFAPGPS